MPLQHFDKVTGIVRYPLSTDGMGNGSGGISFDEFAYTYALERNLVQAKEMDLKIVGRPGGRPAMNDLVANRNVDIGVISLATAIRKFHEGLNLRILCRDKEFGPGGNSIYVRASSKIRSGSDLGLARAIRFHCAPDSERIIVQQAILEKRYGLKWSALPKEEGS